MGTPSLAGIPELLGLGMGAIAIGLQQCLHEDALRREVNISVSEAAPYFGGGDAIGTYTCG